MRQEWCQLIFAARVIEQAQFHRHIVQPARPKALVEMPQARHDHADHGDLDVGPSLVEYEEIIASATSDLDATVFGMDFRYASKINRIRTLPSDPQGGYRLDAYYDISMGTLYVSRKF